MFHVTNTDAVITLSDVALHNEDEESVLLSVCADGWSGGDNAAVVRATEQRLEGAILVGGDAELSLTLSDGSSFSGYFSGDIKNAEGTVVSTQIGKVSVSWTAQAPGRLQAIAGYHLLTVIPRRCIPTGIRCMWTGNRWLVRQSKIRLAPLRKNKAEENSATGAESSSPFFSFARRKRLQEI